ncbi:RDD family protein [Candidatus Roizmanbacteria bacterium]|nr:RDD family protein [Candidatus Roizmanbacteria bacterium]
MKINMDNSGVSPGSSSVSQVKYAGFGIRFLAYWVDFLILFPLGLIIQQIIGNNPFAIFKLALSDLQKLQASAYNPLGIIISLACALAFFLIFWVNYDGATPGKKLLGIKIVKADGEKLTYPVAIIRYIGYLVSAVTIFFFEIGYLWIIWDKKKQAFHDKIAGTVVVKTEKQPQIALALFLTLVAIFLIFGYMGAAMFKGFVLGFKAVQQKSGDPVAYAQAIFTETNKYRSAQNLPTITEEPNICSYISKRIDELESQKTLTHNNTNSDYDNHQGFLGDMNNPQLRSLYFVKSDNQTEYYGHTKSVTEAPNMVSSWVALQNSQLRDPNYTFGCVRADKRFAVFIVATQAQIPTPTVYNPQQLNNNRVVNPTFPPYATPTMSAAAQEQLTSFQQQFDAAKNRIQQGQH